MSETDTGTGKCAVCGEYICICNFRDNGKAACENCTQLKAEIDRLKEELKDLTKHKDRMYLEKVMLGDRLAECMGCNYNAVDEIERLTTAIRETLADNGHLADGEDCTLIKLKRALERIGQ
jgi:hypothetical protein